jgi:hypothetical protein
VRRGRDGGGGGGRGGRGRNDRRTAEAAHHVFDDRAQGLFINLQLEGGAHGRQGLVDSHFWADRSSGSGHRRYRRCPRRRRRRAASSCRWPGGRSCPGRTARPRRGRRRARRRRRWCWCRGGTARDWPRRPAAGRRTTSLRPFMASSFLVETTGADDTGEEHGGRANGRTRGTGPVTSSRPAADSWAARGRRRHAGAG